MIRKTEAIVLGSRKYGDSAQIVTLFTKTYGKMNFIVQGMRSSRATKKHSYFQPMSCIDVVFYFKETRELQQITESNLNQFWHRLQTVPTRIALGLVALEWFDKAVKEEERNDSLYLLLKNVMLRIENEEKNLVHHFIYFLIQLSLSCGFHPLLETGTHANQFLFFDTETGILKNVKTEPNVGAPFFYFIGATAENCSTISLDNFEKNQIIKLMILFFRQHLEGFKEPGSLAVFKEVFNQELT